MRVTMENQGPEMILVYNADSGFFNTIKDALHKTILPSTYQCNLCALTYGTISMKSRWKEFIARLELSSKFLHKDEFYKILESHPHKIENISFPAIFLHKKGMMCLFVNSNEINRCKTLEDLMSLIDMKVKTFKKKKQSQ